MSYASRITRVLPLAVALACATGNGAEEASEGRGDDRAAPAPAPDTDPAPWSAPGLESGQVPAVLMEQWRQADNRHRCAPLAFASTGRPAAQPRPARFGGGWGVAWDLPDLRSAFGVAGTSVRADEPAYDDWPHRMRWQDGSSAGYGPEGGSGPKQLAYLRIAGQDCLYNVWSHLGRTHLELLLTQLRFAQPQPPDP